jgi:exonuclease SbcC
VARLRAGLADGDACPVCGSLDHPYHDKDAALAAMLDGLRREVERCALQLRENQALLASQRALADASAQQQASARAEHASVGTALAGVEAAWREHPLAIQAPPPEQRAAWFAAQLGALRDEAAALDGQEDAARQALLARDAAQAACDEAAAAHALAQQAGADTAAVLAQAQAAHAALAQRRQQADSALAAVLDELDGAFAAYPGWRNAWQADPAAFHLQSRSQAQAWSAQAADQAARAARLTQLEIEQAAARAEASQAQAMHAASATELERIDADIAAKRAARGALWDGTPVSQVELALDTAIGAARSAQAGAASASELAMQAEAQAQAALAHGSARIGALAALAAGAASAVDAWLAAWPDRHAPLTDRAALEDLLAQDTASLAQERSALAALDAAAASAATVLAERREQSARHLQDAGHDTALGAEQLAATLAGLLSERNAALEAATTLRVHLAQDNARRENARTVMADLERQQVVERRWARMNELIGSADGKKFRNYAQQFTLDVLLGYANSHLGQLARRYRLERVLAGGGPSLGLMVRDQDMGGEVRSVNSLSGGESFLVSLALALGLASLSSNRVRVESLFIDEGFGSLDSETLRVAMDALDGLQSMGRKVGVISHVQEMTDRIAARILVQPGGGGSSTVGVL